MIKSQKLLRNKSELELSIEAKVSFSRRAGHEYAI